MIRLPPLPDRSDPRLRLAFAAWIVDHVQPPGIASEGDEIARARIAGWRMGPQEEVRVRRAWGAGVQRLSEILEDQGIPWADPWGRQ